MNKRHSINQVSYTKKRPRKWCSYVRGGEASTRHLRCFCENNLFGKYIFPCCWSGVSTFTWNTDLHWKKNLFWPVFPNFCTHASVSSSLDGCTHTHNNNINNHGRHPHYLCLSAPKTIKLYKLSHCYVQNQPCHSFSSSNYRFSTKCNPVLVLDWCWRQFQVSSPCESDKNQVAFSSQSWLESHVIMSLRLCFPRQQQWWTTCVCSCCSWLGEALWGFVGIQTRCQIWDTNH